MRTTLHRLARMAVLSGMLATLLPAVTTAPAAAEGEHSASGFEGVKRLDQVACQEAYAGGLLATYFQRGECTRIDFTVTNTTDDTAVNVEFIGPDLKPYKTMEARNIGGGEFRLYFRADDSFVAGENILRATVDGDRAPAGQGSWFLNTLGATFEPVAKEDGTEYRAGEPVTVAGTIAELRDLASTQRTGVPAEFQIRVRTPDGRYRGPFGPFTAADDGSFEVELPGKATAGIRADALTNFQKSVGIDVIQARYTDPTTGDWYAKVAGSSAVTIVSEPDSLLVESKFVSSTGWVKPGDTYPFRVLVTNMTAKAARGAIVKVAPPDGTRFTKAKALKGSGRAVLAKDGAITWQLGTVPARTKAGPTVRTLVVEAKADTLKQDPEIVWKDLSATATLTYAKGPKGLRSTSHGPKVIPPGAEFETARYGDKPFPIVPVDYRDRKHEDGHSGEVLARVVNSPDVEGSTFNLYQEMSYGQLFPFGEVGSAGVASAGWDYEPGFAFTAPDPTKGTCRGTTVGPLVGTGVEGSPLYPERIRDGWYQLPGDTEYYGGDWPGFTLGVVGSIDSACGDTSKSVYDAAVIADPEIDYNEFDSDKDGVVDFFMMVFVGLGGNGDSQINGTPPYDNIWPHSSSLEFAYQDPITGLSGYISDDQLRSLEDVPQCWLSEDFANYDDCAKHGGKGKDSLPVFVRVGPYNVNPESAIEAASVISHEYGHHLGLPDFYSSYEAYNDWNLMAADYSQHMTIFSKQELGWVVPEFLQPGETRTVKNWREIKGDTGRIVWRRPDGKLYELSAKNGDQGIHNGQAYALKLPRKLVIDPKVVEEQASAPWVFYSGRGNDFGCPPKAGHNLDVALPELAEVEPGTPVTVEFKSSWDIEWDWDYGFVLTTTDGKTYTSHPSENGYTTPKEYNPNSAGCITQLDNGLTGQSGAYAAGPAEVWKSRNPAHNEYDDGAPFIDDAYDISELAGEENAVLRFAYFTDPAFDRPGWFIDDIVVKAGDEVIYSSDLSKEEPLRYFPGGCGDEGMKVAATCTAGWTRLKADAPAELDHGYFLELRDRSGFDFNGRGQSDRGEILWEPGVLIEYTDEAHGYGNNGVPQPPAQHYLDSQPIPGKDCGNALADPDDDEVVLTSPTCEDAAFTAAKEDDHFDDDPNDEGGVWVDNFEDDSNESGFWEFGYDCLTMDVLRMKGNTNNSEALPSDLTADVRIAAGKGCAGWRYSDGIVPGKPIAKIATRDRQVEAEETVLLDASGSADDDTPVEALRFEWDLDGDGAFETTGQTVRRAFPAGLQRPALRVTDRDGQQDVTTLELRVRGAGGAVAPATLAGAPLPATGGGAALLGVLAVAGAVALRRRR